MAAYQCLNCGQIERGYENCCNAPDLFRINDMPAEIKRLRAAQFALQPLSDEQTDSLFKAWRSARDLGATDLMRSVQLALASHNGMKLEAR